VLDAWFPPSPRVVAALADRPERLLQTSPPPAASPLVSGIARRWSIAEPSIAVGAGSSDLIYRAFNEWLTPSSRVLLVDPTYAEYAHVVENVVGASLVRLSARRADGYRVAKDRLRAALRERWDLVVLVNPNNPTGTLLDRDTLSGLLQACRRSTRVWIDEAYVHLASDASVVDLAARSENVFVVRSFSKAYALSGVRAAFLAGPPGAVALLRRKTPPWIVGFPAQVAVLRALEDEAYYAARYEETRALRTMLADRLRSELGLDVVEGATASVLVHVDGRAESAAEVCSRTARDGVFLRDATGFGPSIGRSTLRISVKSASANDRVVRALARALG
jgi:histidinol-phosphate/aromatic aminotransferase/cobyric acid decarboxylase-like protein